MRNQLEVFQRLIAMQNLIRRLADLCTVDVYVSPQTCACVGQLEQQAQQAKQDFLVHDDVDRLKQRLQELERGAEQARQLCDCLSQNDELKRLIKPVLCDAYSEIRDLKHFVH